MRAANPYEYVDAVYLVLIIHDTRSILSHLVFPKRFSVCEFFESIFSKPPSVSDPMLRLSDTNGLR